MKLAEGTWQIIVFLETVLHKFDMNKYKFITLITIVISVFCFTVLV